MTDNTEKFAKWISKIVIAEGIIAGFENENYPTTMQNLKDFWSLVLGNMINDAERHARGQK